jgi:hypothetical protein
MSDKLQFGESPRSGRKRVAQGESASPGTAPVFTPLTRVAGDRSCAIVGCLLLSPTTWARRLSHANPGLAELALGYMPSPTAWA